MISANEECEECSIYFVFEDAFHAVQNTLPTVWMPLYGRPSAKAEKLMQKAV
jgi:hypothetical protein